MVRNIAFGNRLVLFVARRNHPSPCDRCVKYGLSTRISTTRGIMSPPQFHPSALVKSDDINAQLREILRLPQTSQGLTSRWNDIQKLVQTSFKCVTSEELLIKLLDRLAKEMHHPSELNSLLKAVTYQWRNNYIGTKDKSSLPWQPSQLVKKLQAWSSLYGVHSDTSIYTMVLEAVASNARDAEEGVDFADALLEWMIDQARNHHNFAVQPTTVSVGVVMNAWVSSGRKEASDRIETWLARLHSLTEEGWPNLQPNTILYNILLHALAKEKNPARVEQVLQSMLHGSPGVSPDHISFSTLLSAYTKQETPEALENAEVLLEQMLELYQSGMESVKPNVVSFSTVMNGFATLGEAESAERLLRKLESLYHETGDLDWEPDIAAYNIVLLAWSKANRPDRASIMLQDIIERSIVKPNSHSFDAVLSGWAKAGCPEQAEACLNQMHEYYTMGGHESPPTVVTYNIVLDAWAKSRRRDAWERAQNILQHMDVLYKAGEEGVKPTTRTWNTVFNCFRYCGHGDFHHAFRLLDKFLVAVDEGSVDGSPNLITWNTLLAACARNTKDDYRVNQIWKMMRDRGCKPDIITYNTTFSCYSQYSGRKNESRRTMESYLDSLRNDKTLVPTATTYLALIDAWINFGMLENAESVLQDLVTTATSASNGLDPVLEPFHRVLMAWSDVGEPRRVESLVLLMEELKDRARLEHLKPTSETYNILLQAWARSKKRQAGERTDIILREMASRGVSINLKSYNFTLTAWANSGDPTALTKIESIILEMILHQKPELMPDNVTYNTWLKAILGGEESAKLRRIKELLRTMKIHNFEPNDLMLERVQKVIGAGSDERLTKHFPLPFKQE